MAANCAAKACEVSSNCNCAAGKEDDDNDDEALSLCDLPFELMKAEDRSSKDAQVIETDAQEEFHFLSWGNPEKESAMCTADEVFFRGQMLPLRLSVSSDSSLATFTGLYRDLTRSESRSESSVDHGSSSTGFTSNSSRSSSVRSQNSSSSTVTTSTTTARRVSEPRVQNKFHSHRSPKPQISYSNLRQSSAGRHSRKSVSAWDFVRIGVFSAPEIGLEDLKSRPRNSLCNNSVSRNSSSSSSNKSFNPNESSRYGTTIADSTAANNNDKSNQGTSIKQLIGRSGGLLSGCKCTVETVQANIVVIKNGTKSTDVSESATHAKKEKVLDSKKQKQREKHGKQAMSHRRTFEWLKELPHASYSNENEPLLIP